MDQILGVSKSYQGGWSSPIASLFSKSYSQYSMNSPQFKLISMIVDGKSVPISSQLGTYVEGDEIGISFNLQGNAGGYYNQSQNYYIFESNTGTFTWALAGSLSNLFLPPPVTITFMMENNSLCEGTTTHPVYDESVTAYAADYWNIPITVTLIVPESLGQKDIKALEEGIL